MRDAIDTDLDMKKEQVRKLLDSDEFLKLQAEFYRRLWTELIEVGFSEEQALRIIGGG